MAVKFFGQYLVEKGIVSSETLLKAIELQESTNLSFGETAIAMQLMNTADVERVNMAQRGEDLRFGDMAVKLGILSEEQVRHVLTRQKNDHIYIGESLVRVGGLTPGELEIRLGEFKAEQALYATDKVAIPAGAPFPQFLEIAADLTYKMLTRVALLNCRPDLPVVADRLEPNDVIAAMDLYGDINARYFISVSTAIQKKIARAILSEENVDGEPQEVLEDTVMEFVNVVCGNLVAKAAQIGINIDIAPPEITDGSEGATPLLGQTGLLFPVALAEGGEVTMAIFIKDGD